jgi:hypothetical protein
MNEEGSSIGVFLEALPCSNTSEQGQRDKTIDGEPDGAGGGVLASSGKGLPSMEGECSHLMPLLSSIGGWQTTREGRTLKQEKEKDVR